MKTEFQAEKEKGTEGVTQTAELTIQFMQLDLTSLNSTKTFIEQFKASGRKLNVLVCNAGIVYVPLGNFNFCTDIELFISILLRHMQEEFDDTKVLIRIMKSKKERQHNDQKRKRTKTTHIDLQNIHIKLKIE